MEGEGEAFQGGEGIRASLEGEEEGGAGGDTLVTVVC